MTDRLMTVYPDNTLAEVKELFEREAIRHLPVIKHGTLVGMISKSDLNAFEKNYAFYAENEGELHTYLRNCKVGKIMTKGLATLSPDALLSEALELFKENIFHAIPILDDGDLVGIITPHDIICALSEKLIQPELNE